MSTYHKIHDFQDFFLILNIHLRFTINTNCVCEELSLTIDIGQIT